MTGCGYANCRSGVKGLLIIFPQEEASSEHGARETRTLTVVKGFDLGGGIVYGDVYRLLRSIVDVNINNAKLRMYIPNILHLLPH